MATKTAYRPRSIKELDRKSQAHLKEILTKELAALSEGELAFLEARRMYLTARELESYGIKIPKMSAPVEAPAKTEEEPSGEAIDEAGDEEDTEAGDAEETDEESEDDADLKDELDEAEDFADLDPDTDKPLAKAEKPAGKPKGRPAGAKK